MQYAAQLKGVYRVGFLCVEGAPAVEILKTARLHDANCIVMAHHSVERDPERALLGWTVVKVALNASCPTLSVNRSSDMRCGLEAAGETGAGQG